MCKYKCLIILILIRFVQCSDKYPYQAGSKGRGGDKNNPNDQENNLDLIEKELENILTDDEDENNTIVKGIQKILIDDSKTSPHGKQEPSYFTDYNIAEDLEYTYSNEQQNITSGITQPISSYQNWSSLPCFLPGTTDPPLPIPVSQFVIQQNHDPYKYPIQTPYDPSIFSITEKHLTKPEQRLEVNQLEKHRFVLRTPNASELPSTHHPYGFIPNSQLINTGPGLLPIPTFGLLSLQPGLLSNPPKKIKKTKYRHTKQTKPSGLNLTVEIQINVTKPTQQTKEPSETTKYTTEPSGLEPETIPVEVGSDEDEDEEPPEPPKGPTGPGDGDQPEEGEESGDGEDGEEKDDDQTQKIPSIDAIVFYKKDIKGNLVLMGKEDYSVSLSTRNILRYEFFEKLRKIMYLDEVVYEDVGKKRYIKVLTYNKYFKTFTGIRKDGYFIMKKFKKKWIFYTRKIPNFVHFFTKDDKGNYLELTNESYKIELSAMGSVKFIFHPNVKCFKVLTKTQIIWQKEGDDDGDYPTTICVTDRHNILLYFNHSSIVFGKTRGKYKKMQHKIEKGY
uniref:SVSP1 n=1 Tax=Theileria annulata TaxID=5874 RepID=D3XP16_THEAN|nr:SVSP1 [Theileria annulata]ADD12137.1 SVSP1 [Theileria annulata]